MMGHYVMKEQSLLMDRNDLRQRGKINASP
jgi:hypothetical protein